MKIIANVSHLDHALTAEHVRLIAERFADRQGFFIESFELPAELPAVPCGLHGPIVGDSAVPESECRYVVRGNRKGASRVCSRPVRLTRTLTVIAGPHEDDPCVMYTAFGGPAALREPYDAKPDDAAASREFWSQHALSAE